MLIADLPTKEIMYDLRCLYDLSFLARLEPDPKTTLAIACCVLCVLLYCVWRLFETRGKGAAWLCVLCLTESQIAVFPLHCCIMLERRF